MAGDDRVDHQRRERVDHTATRKALPDPHESAGIELNPDAGRRSGTLPPARSRSTKTSGVAPS